MTQKSISETEFVKNWKAGEDSPEQHNFEIIKNFYEAFARNDAGGMSVFYHENIRFSDPVFTDLRGANAAKMWRMLLENNKGNIKVFAENIKSDAEKGSADWTAEYVFSRTGRKVINKVHAEFEFKDGKIFRHTDKFDFWKWTRQALGLSGLLLGWSPLMKRKVRANAHTALLGFRQ